MNHPARTSSTKSRAPPLRLKRRPAVPDEATALLQDRRILLLLLILRIFNALTIKTFFQPDEYYQSLEPAWRLVFGYGELTWEWKEGIRSFFYPGVFAAVWRVLQLLGIPNANVLVRLWASTLLTV